MDFQSYSLIISYRISNVVRGVCVDIFWNSSLQGEVCVAERTAGSAGGNARYLPFQPGTDKRNSRSGNYACICESASH